MGFYEWTVVLGDLIAFLNSGNATDLTSLVFILYDIKHWQNGEGGD